jgi:peptidoglycan hydrolase-like protein with peptidoglycan-binding domain
MITLGDKGKEVSQLQKRLSMLGYDLVIDGVFGNKTLRSLKAFQKKYGLLVDGIAGEQTFSALKAAQKRTAKEEKENNFRGREYGELDVDVNHHLGSEQYIKQTFDKDKIFIHYTVSGPDAKKVIKYWDGNSPRVATAFVMSGRGIEDGKIYEAYNPDYWSYHLGVKGSKGKLDKNSIGIEVCAWGRLDKKGDKFYNHYGSEVSTEEVCTLDEAWRGSKYYHKPSDKQMASLEKLLLWIIGEYKIPVQNIDFNRDWAEYNDTLVRDKTPGIWTHTNVRTDKQDMYPDQRMFDVLNKVKEKINE